MKDELKSESQAEMGGAEKSGKAHFSAQLIFLLSFRLASNQRASVILSQSGSKWIKVDQSDSIWSSLRPEPVQVFNNEQLAE
jgi:hypothetical protein